VKLLTRSFTSIFNTFIIMPTILGTDRGKNKALLTIASHPLYRPLPCFLQISRRYSRFAPSSLALKSRGKSAPFSKSGAF
jgi:hypothetical protein